MVHTHTVTKDQVKGTAAAIFKSAPFTISDVTHFTLIEFSTETGLHQSFYTLSDNGISTPLSICTPVSSFYDFLLTFLALSVGTTPSGSKSDISSDALHAASATISFSTALDISQTVHWSSHFQATCQHHQ